jgi:drug/metabolite transporter (DMT)-like permease
LAVAPLVVVLILAAALLHATWNALLRSGADRLGAMTLMCVVSASAGAVMAAASPLPAAAAWPYAALSAVIQIVYCVVLVKAYEAGDLTQIFPIARGSAPLLVALGALLTAGEQPSPLALGGLALVSGGIVGLSFGRDRPHLHSTLAALGCGALIAGYTISDGMGVRLAHQPVAYIGWTFLLQGAPMPLVYRALRGRWPPLGRDRDTLKGLGGGLLSVLSYGVVVWAMGHAQMARVSGLRETSILFAAVIGVTFLKEPLSLRRGLCALLIAAGAALLAATH